jgi:hypothetical protein
MTDFIKYKQNVTPLRFNSCLIQSILTDIIYICIYYLSVLDLTKLVTTLTHKQHYPITWNASIYFIEGF